MCPVPSLVKLIVGTSILGLLLLAIVHFRDVLWLFLICPFLLLSFYLG